MEIFYIPALILLTVLTRCLPRLFRRHNYSSDTWFHLLAAERIRQAHFRMPLALKGFIPSATYWYPPLFHYLFSLFNKTKRELIEPFWGAVVDVCYVILIYCFSYYVAGRFYLNLRPSDIAFLSGIIFVFSPSLVSIGINDRVFVANSRALGQLFFSLSLISAYIYYSGNNFPAFIYSIAFGVLLLLTSRFGAQAFIFITFLLSIFLRSLPLFLLPYICIVFAILLTKGYCLKLFISHFRYLKFYFSFLAENGLYTKNRNNLGKIRNLIKPFVFKNLKKLLYELYLINSYTSFLFKNLFLIIIIIAAIKNPQFFFGDSLKIFLFFWLMSCFILFLITSQRPFLFLGDPDRYMEYGIVPASIFISSYLLIQNTPVIWKSFLIILGINVMMLLGSYLYVIKKRFVEPEASKQDLFDTLNKSKAQENILTLPYVTFAHEVIYRTTHNAVYPLGDFNPQGKEVFKELFNPYPIISRDIEKIILKYNISMIICERAALDFHKKNGYNYNLSEYKPEFENEDFLVYRVH